MFKIVKIKIQIFQIKMEKFINDDLVIKNELYNEFKDSIICPICLKILINPFMCMNCQNVYCKNCIDKWKERNNKCPNRCQNPNYQKSIEKNFILSKLKIQCPNCKSEIEYNNVEKHHNSCKIQGKKKMKKIDKKEVKKLNKNKNIITKIKSKKYI